MEKTLILLKPDTIQRGLIGEIIQKFEKVGARVVGLKMLIATKDQAMGHYTEDLAKRRGEEVRKIMVDFIQSGPIVAIALEGVEIVEVVRKLVGETEPKKASPGTIRGDYSHVSFAYANKMNKPINNLIHASASVEDAEAEIKVWFRDDEILTYESSHSTHTL